MATDIRLKELLPELTDRIVDTYKEIETINHLGHCPLPSVEVVVEITEDLKEILYPGYRKRQNLHLGNVTYHIGDLIDSLYDRLTQQIARALRHDYRRKHKLTCTDIQPDFEALGRRSSFCPRFPQSAAFWRQMYRPHMTATPPPAGSTKSSSATQGSRRSRPIAWLTNYFVCRFL